MPPGPVNDYATLALAFVRALTDGHVPTAYAMTSADYQRRMSIEALQAAYDAMVPADFGRVTSLEVGLTMESWPDKQPAAAEAAAASFAA